MSNFLDYKLYNKAKTMATSTGEEFRLLLGELYLICETHKNEKLPVSPIPSRRYIKSVVDQIFNSWNLFVKRCEKENYPYSSLFYDYSYKYMFMKNDKLREIYNSL